MPMHPMQGVGGGYMHMPLRMPQPDNAGHAHMQMCPPHFGAPIGAASGPFQHAADPWARSDEPTVFSQRWLPPQVAARAAYFDHASRSLPPVPQFDLAHAACATFSATGYAGTIAGIGRPNASSSTKRWRLPTVGAATPCRCRWLARRYDRDSACCSYSTLFSCTYHILPGVGAITTAGQSTAAVSRAAVWNRPVVSSAPYLVGEGGTGQCLASLAHAGAPSALAQLFQFASDRARTAPPARLCAFRSSRRSAVPSECAAQRSARHSACFGARPAGAEPTLLG
jgi:hypothetical protein